MVRAIKILTGVIVFILFAITGLYSGIFPGSINSAQEKLAANVERSIKLYGADWADVEMRGQKVVLAGEAPNVDALLATVDAALKSKWSGGALVGGVTKVDARAATVYDGPPIVDPFVWRATHANGELKFAGYVPSQAGRDRIYTTAAERFPDATIIGALEIAGGVTLEQDWMTTVTIALQMLSLLEAGEVSAENTEFLLTGTSNDEGVEGAIAVLAGSAPARYSFDNALIIVEPENIGPGPIEDAVADENAAADAAEQCRVRIDALVSGLSISFRTAATDVSASERAKLDAVRDALVVCPSAHLTITGHTDSRGRTSRNYQLSLFRADAVGAYLKAAGVNASQITTDGAGSSQPIASNLTPDGRAQNRRIEFSVEIRE
ncbi:MAG: OmpA family protein [Marinicaulis sp.]|nr:OmpA family protein [Marinicaulis sp.]